MKIGLKSCGAASAVLGCLAFPFPEWAWAQSSGTPALPEIRVDANVAPETATSPVIGYRARNAATATKTDTPLAETPQAVTVITRDQIVDQGASNLQDALNYAAGVRSDAYGLDSRTDSARVRGGIPDEYLDGLRKNFDYYTSNARTDLYTLERIEVLRGPSAMLFGQGSTAGVVNMVSKRPLAQTQREIGVQFGSFGRKQLQADLTGPLTEDGKWSYRLIAVGRDADTQVDYVRDDRSLLAPSLTWRPSADTSLTLQALWQKDKTGSTSQFFPWEGVLLPNPNGRIPTSRFIGEPGYDRYNTERSTLGWLFEHRFNDRWSVRQNVRFTRNNVDYTGFYGDSFTLPGGWAGDPVNKRLFGRFADSSITKVDMSTADQHVEGRFETGAVRHQVLVGFDYARYKLNRLSGFDFPQYLGGTQPLIDAYAPVYGLPFDQPELSADPQSRLRQTGIYLQDQLKFGDHWIVVAGVRHDRVTNSVEGQDDQESSATSKRLALLYAADNGWSPYLSYGESFTPVAGLNRANQRFTPTRGKQWEAGIKYLPANGDVNFGAAVYDLRETNRLVSDPNDPNNSLQTGRTKTTGLELELKARLARDLDLIANYNYTDIDSALEAVPKHQASVWGKYRFAIAGNNGFSVGLGVRWLGSFNDGAAPTTPSVTLLDALFAYDTGRWRYAINVGNLTDKVYVSTCLSRGDCWYGARRNVVASATYRF
ncbi:MAG: TonB-dependent siderophore receptor [Gammaproteobacteria bacterium]|nr:TonB-dependent siderophore receptor [Gammaproteobacteria bacterium]